MTSQRAETVVTELTRRAWTVAVAESLTGGLAVAGLVDVAGASAVVRGGVVAYAVDVKRDVLGVEAGLLADPGPVSAEVARAMAECVARLLGADVGLATTGVAGPGPDADGVPAGTVYVAVAGRGLDQVIHMRTGGNRDAVRRSAVEVLYATLLEGLAMPWNMSGACYVDM